MVILVVFNSFNVVKNLKKSDLVAPKAPILHHYFVVDFKQIVGVKAIYDMHKYFMTKHNISP